MLIRRCVQFTIKNRRPFSAWNETYTPSPPFHRVARSFSFDRWRDRVHTDPAVRFKIDGTVDRAQFLSPALFSSCGAADGSLFASVTPCPHKVCVLSIVHSRLARANTNSLTYPCAHTTKLFWVARCCRPPFHFSLPCPGLHTFSEFFVATTSDRPTRVECSATMPISSSTLTGMRLRSRKPSLFALPLKTARSLSTGRFIPLAGKWLPLTPVSMLEVVSTSMTTNYSLKPMRSVVDCPPFHTAFEQVHVDGFAA